MRHRHFPSSTRCISISQVLMSELGVFREGDVRQNELRTMASSPSLSSTHVGMLMNSSIMVARNNTILHNPSFHMHRCYSMYLTSRYNVMREHERHVYGICQFQVVLCKSCRMVSPFSSSPSSLASLISVTRALALVTMTEAAFDLSFMAFTRLLTCRNEVLVLLRAFIRCVLEAYANFATFFSI